MSARTPSEKVTGSGDTAVPAKPIRCAVIQLARIGDTLQSLMALRAAKQLYPQLEITFIARERFAEAARRVSWIKEVIVFPSEELLGPILRADKKKARPVGPALSGIARWIIPLVNEPWDLVVNWTYSDASSYLTGLLPGRVKLGYTRRKDLGFSSADGWSHYLMSIVQGAVEQNIHLTDILTTQLLTALQIHFGDPANEGNSAVTSKSFFSLRLGENDLGILARENSRKWLAVQLGASQDSKTWEPKKWAALLALITRRHPDYTVILLGGKEDIPREKQLRRELENLTPASALDRVVSLVGQTEFDLWASVVSRAQWLLSGDTAAVHLASVLGTRVLNISVGPVRWSETGPYGNGHYVVAPARPCEACAGRGRTHSCKVDVTPEAVYASWSYASSEWAHRRQITIESHFERLGYAEHLPAVSVYRARIRDTEAGGGLVYDSVISRPLGFSDWVGMAVGHIARSWYCGWVPAVGAELKREHISPALVRKLRELDEAAQVLSRVCGEASLTALSLKKRSERLRSDKLMGVQDREEIRELARKLFELDDLMERLGRTTTPLKGLAQMLKVLMNGLRGDHLADLGQESADCYRQISDGVAILREWLKFTLQLARPVALRAVPSAVSTAAATKSEEGERLL